MGSVEMRSSQVVVDLDSDEETPFSSTHPTNKMQSTQFETTGISSPTHVSHPWALRRMRHIRVFRSIYIVLIKAKINMLLPFGPLAIVMHYVTGKHHVRFQYNFLWYTSAALSVLFMCAICLFLLGMGVLLQLIGYYTIGWASWLCNWVHTGFPYFLISNIFVVLPYNLHILWKILTLFFIDPCCRQLALFTGPTGRVFYPCCI